MGVGDAEVGRVDVAEDGAHEGQRGQPLDPRPAGRGRRRRARPHGPRRGPARSTGDPALGEDEGVAVHVGLDVAQEQVRGGHRAPRQGRRPRGRRRGSRSRSWPRGRGRTPRGSRGRRDRRPGRPPRATRRSPTPGSAAKRSVRTEGTRRVSAVAHPADDGGGRHERLRAAQVAAQARACRSCWIVEWPTEIPFPRLAVSSGRPFDDHPRPDPRAEGQPDDVVDPPGGTEAPLGEGGGLAIVDAADGHPELGLERLPQRKRLDPADLAGR